MITFRFYLVTLVAVFLAIALGVVIGSTFIEPALVDNLRNQVERVQGNLDDRLATIDGLDEENQRLEVYVEQSAPFAVDGRLTGSSAVIVAEPGLDREPVERLVGRLRQAGARTDGIVWLDPRIALLEPEQAAELRAALGLDRSVEGPRPAAWETVLGEVAEVTGAEIGVDAVDQLAATTTPDTTRATTAPDADPGAAPRVFEIASLAALEEAGFVEIQRIDEGDMPVETASEPGEAVVPLAVVLVTGPGSDLDDDGDLMADLARQQSALGLPTLVAELYEETDEGPGRGAHVASIRDDGELSTIVATVDDLELLQGRVASVLAIADLGGGVVGHYGYGSGAERVLPPWLGP